MQSTHRISLIFGHHPISNMHSAVSSRETRLARRARSTSKMSAILGVALFVGLMWRADARPKMDPVLDSAITEFVDAQNGDDALKEKSSRTLDALYADPARSRDPLILVFCGAAKARLAETTILPWSKINHAEDGLALIDKALQRLEAKDETAESGFTPPAKEVRFVAASVYLIVPSALFHRDAQGNKLLDDLLATVDTDSTPKDFKAAINVLAGQRAAKAGDKNKARAYFNKAIDYDSPQEAADAKRELKALDA